jgi:hypothetical protein
MQVDQVGLRAIEDSPELFRRDRVSRSVQFRQVVDVWARGEAMDWNAVVDVLFLRHSGRGNFDLRAKAC